MYLRDSGGEHSKDRQKVAKGAIEQPYKTNCAKLKKKFKKMRAI